MLPEHGAISRPPSTSAAMALAPLTAPMACSCHALMLVYTAVPCFLLKVCCHLCGSGDGRRGQPNRWQDHHRGWLQECSLRRLRLQDGHVERHQHVDLPLLYEPCHEMLACCRRATMATLLQPTTIRTESLIVDR